MIALNQYQTENIYVCAELAVEALAITTEDVRAKGIAPGYEDHYLAGYLGAHLRHLVRVLYDLGLSPDLDKSKLPTMIQEEAC